MLIFANVIQEAFSPLIALFEAIMVFIHDNIVPISWGLSIIGLTIIVRAVLMPLTFSQFRSMRKLQLLMPQLKEVQERYKDDKQRQNEEMMKFYRENKVNPFASCLPMVLQVPVFIALFYMLREDLKKHICGPQLVAHYNKLVAHYNALHPHATHAMVASAAKLPSQYVSKVPCDHVAPGSAKFLFIPDITTKATGWVLIVLIVAYIASQLVSTMLMSATTDKNQRLMMLGLPFVFTIFVINFPAGLLVYWITTNIWTVGQGYFVRRTLGPPPVPPPKGGKAPPASAAGANGKPPPGGAAPQPALSGAGGGGSAPPPPPRKKKKRSGRRR